MTFVVFTGSRTWTDRETVLRRMQLFPRDTMIIEGGAPGLDTIAGVIADRLGLPHATIRANWTYYGKTAGPIRNGWMLSLPVSLVVAYHENLSQSRGTAQCVQSARKKHIPVELIETVNRPSLS